MTQLVYLGAGTLAGGFSRYFLSGAIHKSFGTAFPYGTLAVNLIGCFVIGFLGVLAEEKFLLGAEGRLLLMTGFCGAFTTFSAFIFETGNLIKEGDLKKAILNVVLSLVAGFIVYKCGVVLGKTI